MSKRTYRSVPVNDVKQPELLVQFSGRAVVIAIDVAKHALKAAVIDRESGDIVSFWSWRAPDDTRKFVSLVSSLAEVARVEVVLEPTGTYGDPLRGLFGALSIPVFKVSAKHTHDAAEIYDGVPSQHDAKCAAIIGWLHCQGRSSRWTEASTDMRDLTAAVDVMVLFDKQEQACLGRLEGKLARHFPELSGVLDLGSATQLALLEQFADPASIKAQPAAARDLMRRVGGALLAEAKIELVIAAASTSTGVPMSAGERRMMTVLARETDRQRKEGNAAAKQVEKVGKELEPVTRMSEVVGKKTAAVVFVDAGDPNAYASAPAYVKALGLNLKIRNSGKPADVGKLKITKRGSGRARMYLYMAVLRLIQSELCFRAWYERKVEREGGKRKLLAIIALMRKLAAALWHVARGKKFDATQLFDVERLGLAA